MLFYNFNAKNTKRKVTIAFDLIDSHLSFSRGVLDGFFENFGAVQQNVRDVPVTATGKTQDILRSHWRHDIVVKLHPLIAFVTHPTDVMTGR